MSEPKSAVSARLDKALAEAHPLALQGPTGQNKAAGVLLKANVAALLTGYFRRNSVPEGPAEELTSEVLVRLVTKMPTDKAPTSAWFWTLARNTVISWVRKRDAESRGGSQADNGPTEVALDEDDFVQLIDREFGVSDLPAWVRDCVHKAAHLLQVEDHKTAEVLWLAYMDYSAEDIAVHFGAKAGAVTPTQLGAARQRKSHALGIARGYFEHCRE